MNNESVAVLFSGGSDSTLAAALAARRFKQIYLMTYHHSFMFFHNKIEINVKALQQLFPQNEFIRHYDDVNSLFKKLFFKKLVSDFKRYKTMLISWICGSCKLAMHTKTVDFCQRHSINHVYCGAHEESARIFPAQMPSNIDKLKEFYERHGIKYETPVYHMERTDHILYDMGILKNRNVKNQHLFYSTQHTCPLGIILHAHSRIYYTKVYGLKRYKHIASEIFQSRIEEIDKILQECC